MTQSVQPTRTAADGWPRVELLWFADCPNHQLARSMVIEAVTRLDLQVVLDDIDATDPAVALAHRFPGSPTIRVDGADVDPSFTDPGDYTPRCRLYRTTDGLGGLPDPAWLQIALADAAARRRRDDPTH